MPLTNAQYARIEREYGRRRQRNAETRAARQAEAYAAIPGLKQTEEALSDLEAERVRCRILGNAKDEAELTEQIRQHRERRDLLLKKAGWPADALQNSFDCPLCRDTGYIDGEPCACRKRAVIELLYDQSAICENLERENFSSFDITLFDDTPPKEPGKLSGRQQMEINREVCLRFVDRFAEEGGNLLFMGQAGTGKTFLSNCVAKALLDRMFSVIYLSASEMFDLLTKQAFGRGGEETEDLSGHLLDCDLLIIDDLGAGVENRFAPSNLFWCLNERLLRRKSVLISTNLSMNDITAEYTDRVASRLIGSFRILPFPGRDLRFIKRQSEVQSRR